MQFFDSTSKDFVNHTALLQGIKTDKFSHSFDSKTNFKIIYISFHTVLNLTTITNKKKYHSKVHCDVLYKL